MKEIVFLPIEQLFQHPDNPRKELGDLTELADSIRENGVLQNLTVIAGRPMTHEEWSALEKQYDENPTEEVRVKMNSMHCDDGYTVVIGHRRLAAAKFAGLTELPCVIVEMTHKEQLQTMLMENMQRSDLTAYEQAQGFQQLSFLGVSVEEISAKSGFSQSTVRRRLKMAELNPNILKEVSSGRQISIGDFDRLAEIEDIDTRNKVLESIGTRDFDANLSRSLTTQQERKNRPLVKKWLKEVGAKEIPSKDRYSSAYETYPGCSYYIYLSKWGEAGNKPPESVKDAVFFELSQTSLRLFRKKPKAKPVKRPQEEIDKEKAIAAAWKSLEETAILAYDLRKKFVEKLTVTKKNRETVLYGALMAIFADIFDYAYQDRKSIKTILGIENEDSELALKVAEKLDAITDENLPRLIHLGFGDDDKTLCTGPGHHGNFPYFRCSGKLKLLYEWLQLLGYEPCTEELQMLSGGHAGYHAKEAFEQTLKEKK